MLKLTIYTDNAAFDDDARAPELARILRRLADQLEEVQDAGEEREFRLFDVNGNNVGFAALDEREGA